MDKPPNKEFGKRRPVVARPGPSAPVKRSGHVALLMMGTLAVGGGAYALMPSENCRPPSPGMAGPAIPQIKPNARRGDLHPVARAEEARPPAAVSSRAIPRLAMRLRARPIPARAG